MINVTNLTTSMLSDFPVEKMSKSLLIENNYKEDGGLSPEEAIAQLN